ncbi:hypothetical protein J6590_066896 [Homalodisca vitripennis]|nr:hypothetical protein J6590_066896 [Homalodisca vitripennis]
MLSQVDEVILMGDFNVDLLGNNKPEFKYFRNLLASMNLAQIVNEPTLETDNTAALIDHIIAKKDYFAAKLKCSDSKSFWATLRAGDLKVGTAGGSVSVNISPGEINRYFAGLGSDNSVNPQRLAFYKHATCEKVQDKFQFR